MRIQTQWTKDTYEYAHEGETFVVHFCYIIVSNLFVEQHMHARTQDVNARFLSFPTRKDTCALTV
jgi:hypothetical protein